jgi:hypothetical protein
LLAVVERAGLTGGGLPTLMPLTGDHHHVTGASPADGVVDRRAYLRPACAN